MPFQGPRLENTSSNVLKAQKLGLTLAPKAPSCKWVGGAEVGADGATEDEDADEAAEEGDLDVVEGLLEL